MDIDMKKDFKEFKTLLVSFIQTASKRYGYDRLEEWEKPVYGYLHSMLDKYGFENGEDNGENKDGLFWWEIYQKTSNITHSRYLETEVARHHASAWERNAALRKEMIQIRFDDEEIMILE